MPRTREKLETRPSLAPNGRPEPARGAGPGPLGQAGHHQGVRLRRARRASNRVVRHSLLWRARMAPVALESEDAGHLDLLAGSRLLLTRTALSMRPPEGRGPAPSIRQLVVAIGDLAMAPGDHPTRERAADRALLLARTVAASPPRSQAALTASTAIRMAAADIGASAGVDQVSRRPAPAPGPRGTSAR